MENVPSHHHCKVCGAAIPLEDPVCSVKCAQARGAQVRQQRLYTVMFVVISLMLVLAIFVHP